MVAGLTQNEKSDRRSDALKAILNVKPMVRLSLLASINFNSPFNLADSMNRYFYLLLVFCFFSPFAQAQNYFALGGKGNDFCQDIRKDADGNIYMTLAFSDTIDLDPSPTVRRLVVSKGETDIAVLKLDRQGKFIWGFSVGSAKADMPFVLRFDANRNIYIGGYYSDIFDANPLPNVANNLALSGVRDGFIAKYDSEGRYLAAFKIGGVSDDAVSDFSVDAAGNLYVGGKYSGQVDFEPGTAVRNLTSRGLGDTFLAKYNDQFALQWAMSFGGTLDDVPEGNNVALALDQSNNVYLYTLFAQSINLSPLDARSNTFARPPDSLNTLVSKYNSSGNYIGAFYISSPRRMYSSSGGITVDGTGKVVITGGFQNTANFNPSSVDNTVNTTGGRDIFIAKYSNSLVYEWAVKAGSSEDDQGTRIAFDKGNNLIATGFYRGTAVYSGGNNLLTTNSLSAAGSAEMFVAKYSSFGGVLWTRALGANTQSSQITSGTALAVDGFENITVGGNYFGLPLVDRNDPLSRLPNRGGSDMVVTKLDKNGVLFEDNTCRGSRDVIKLAGDTVLCEGSFTPIKINFSINDLFSIQWQESADGKNFTNLGGITTNTQIPITTLNNKTFYRAIFLCTDPKDNDTTSVHFVKPSSLRIDAGRNRQIQIGDQITIGGSPTATGGQGRYRYEWSPRSLLSRFNIANPSFIAQNEGVFEFILVASDTNCVISKKVTITVESPLDAQTAALEQSFRIFPNPAQNHTVAEFYLPYYSPVRISILDLKGREVQNLAEQNMGIGQHRIDIRTPKLAPQVYFLRIATERHVLTRKIVLVP